MNENPNDGLPQVWWVSPKHAMATTLTTKQLKAVLLYNNGRILACGDMWDIKSQSLGAGIHRVWIVRAEFDEHGAATK